MDVDVAKAEMVKEMKSDKPDRARLTRLQQDTFPARRQWLKTVWDRGVKSIRDEYPILKEAYFIEKEFLFLNTGKPLKVLQEDLDQMISVVEQVMGKDQTPANEGEDSVFKLMELVLKTVAAKKKYSKKHKALITRMESHDVDTEKLSQKADPPTLPRPAPHPGISWQWHLVHHSGRHQCFMQQGPKACLDTTYHGLLCLGFNLPNAIPADGLATKVLYQGH